jgi:hypothetical protein
MTDSHDPLDTLIDDVARRMTSSPMRAGLAGRVSARLDAAQRERRSWTRQWVFVPAAAACVLVTAVVLVREVLAPAPVLPPALEQTTVRPQPPAVEAVPEPRAPVEPPARRTPSPRAPSSAAVLPPEFAVAPLALSPISGIERIEVPSIARGDQIDITGIAIERIEIAPMP